MPTERLDDELDALIIDDVERGVFKVHRRAFCDPAIFELEKERIFDRTWLYAGHESEFAKPGAYRARTIAGRNVILVRGADDKIRALFNQCTHRGTMLCREGGGEAKFFRCPYHAWTFDTTGRLTGLPMHDAYGDLDRKELNLREGGRLESYNGFLFITFAKSIEPLEQHLGGVREYIDFVADQSPAGMEVLPGTHKYVMRANWKMVVENFVDSYHFTILHHRYIQHLKDSGVATGRPGEQGKFAAGKSLGNGHAVSEHEAYASLGRLAGRWGTMLPEWTKEPVAGIKAELERRVGPERAFRISQTNRNVRVYPNLGLLDHISPVIRMITPRSVNCVDVEEWMLAPKGENAELRSVRLANNQIQVGPAGMVSADDVEVLELAQLGLSNPEQEWVDVSRGMKLRRTLPTDEHQMRGLHRFWHEKMTLGRVRHPHDI